MSDRSDAIAQMVRATTSILDDLIDVERLEGHSDIVVAAFHLRDSLEAFGAACARREKKDA